MRRSPVSSMSLLPTAPVSGREGRRKSGSLKKSAVILGEPICWRCWATDLSRKERGKVVPSKRVRRSPCEPDFPGCLLGERVRPGGHEENWFLRKKDGRCWWGLTPRFRSEPGE